jgi:hypothetical protein
MPWFKHYNNAKSSLRLQQLLNEGGVLAYGQYWLLLELLCQKFDGVNHLIKCNSKEIAVQLNIKPSRTIVVLELLSSCSLVQFNLTGVVFEIDAPILSELKAKDFKRKRQERVGEAEKPPKEIRYKNKEIRYNIKEENQENISSSFVSLENNTPPNFSHISDLFNKTLAGKHSIKHAPLFCSNEILESFHVMCGFEDFRTIEKWENYFNLVKDSEFLTGRSKTNFVVTLDWLIKPDNAFKVFSGKYSNNNSDGMTAEYKRKLDEWAAQDDEVSA